MSKAQFLHNPRCRKSREALALLAEKPLEIEVRAYLEEPLNQEELESLIAKLRKTEGLTKDVLPSGLIRTGEADYKSHYKGKLTNEAAVIEALLKHPKLLERPILINGQKAAIGRPPENILAIL